MSLHCSIVYISLISWLRSDLKIKMEEFHQDFDMAIPIIVLAEYSTETFVMGYHDYNNVWIPEMGEHLETRMEPTNHMDRFAVGVFRHGQPVGHLMKGRTGRYAKTIFYFLRADRNHQCRVEITGRAINEGDKMGMKVPCKLHFVGSNDFIKILKTELHKMYK